MTEPLVVTGDELRAAVSYADAVDVLESAFRDRLPLTPQRTVVERDSDQLLLMPSWGQEAMGVKLVTVGPRNPARGLPLIQGLYVLFSSDTLTPIAILDAVSLTAIRTAAVSAVATRHLAPRDASRLLVFGSGVQAEAHVHALGAVRAITDVAIVPRSSGGATALVERLVAAGVPAREGTVEEVATAQLICTCTTASEPLFDGALLAAGTHVNAVGAHRPDAREVDSVTVARAYVVVETRESAAAEAGDLLIPVAQGAAAAAKVPAAELAEVVSGRAPEPPRGGLTLFKSVGVAFEDLALARFAVDALGRRKPK